MPELVLSRTPRTVLGVLVARFRSAVRRHASGAWSGKGRAGSLTPRGTPVGLDGPMPRTITPVVRGRCRPSPDRVSLGAPSDRHGGSVVAGRLTRGAGEGFLPVLGAPAAGVGRVHGDDGDAGLVGHRGKPGTEPAGGHAGDQLPEAALTSVFLTGLLRREVQVFDRDGLHAAGSGPVQQPGQGVADLGVTVIGAAREVEEEPARAPGRVAMGIETPGGEVVGVQVDADHTVREGGGQRDGRGDRDLPGGGHIPAAPVGVVVDAVGDGPVGRHPVGPLLPAVRKAHVRREEVRAVRGVGQPGERGREFDADLAVRADADRLVAVPLAGLSVRLQKPALRLPPPPPAGLGQPRGMQVMAGAGQALAAAYDVHGPGLPVSPRTLQPVLQDPQAGRDLACHSRVLR